MIELCVTSLYCIILIMILFMQFDNYLVLQFSKTKAYPLYDLEFLVKKQNQVLKNFFGFQNMAQKILRTLVKST